MKHSQQYNLKCLMNCEAYRSDLIDTLCYDAGDNEWWVSSQMKKLLDQILDDSNELTVCKKCNGKGRYMEDDIVGNYSEIECGMCKGKGVNNE